MIVHRRCFAIAAPTHFARYQAGGRTRRPLTEGAGSLTICGARSRGPTTFVFSHNAISIAAMHSRRPLGGGCGSKRAAELRYRRGGTCSDSGPTGRRASRLCQPEMSGSPARAPVEPAPAAIAWHYPVSARSRHITRRFARRLPRRRRPRYRGSAPCFRSSNVPIKVGLL
jgi:hypothetical protein